MTFPSLVPTFHQVPYSTLSRRVDSGSQGLFELTNLLAEKRDIDEKLIVYLLKVSRSNVYGYEIETSSSERLLGFFKNYHLFLSKEHIKLHKEYSENIVKALEDLKVNRSATINRNKVFITNKLREVTAAEEALDRAKKNQSKAKKDVEKAKEKLQGLERTIRENQLKAGGGSSGSLGIEGGHSSTGSSGAAGQPARENKFVMSRMFSAFEVTPEQERDKQSKKLERKREELAQANAAINEKKGHLLDLLAELDESFYKVSQQPSSIYCLSISLVSVE
jgi:hypothetical protein